MAIDKKDLGKLCILKNLRLLRGEEPFDYLKFIIQEIREDGMIVITDKATRAFIVEEKDIQII